MGANLIMIPSHTLDAFEQHIMDIKDRLYSLPHNESISNDLNNIGHSLSSIENEIKKIGDLHKHDEIGLNIRSIERKLIDHSSNPNIISEINSDLRDLYDKVNDISESLREIKTEVTYNKLYIPIILTLILIVLILK